MSRTVKYTSVRSNRKTQLTSRVFLNESGTDRLN